jgi:hypothetical protein
MVYAFMFGLFLGLPVGCYLREAGYANKFQTAYNLFFPNQHEVKMDRYRDKSKEFYDNLKKGNVAVEDFERYVYGGEKNRKVQDDRDKMDDMER